MVATALSAERERTFSIAGGSAQRFRFGQAGENASWSWPAAPASGAEIGTLARFTDFPSNPYSGTAQAPRQLFRKTAQAPVPEPAFRGRPSAPVRTLLRIFDRWGISPGDAATMLGAEAPELIADLRSGAATLRTRDMRDRARLILEIYEGVFSLFQDPQAEAAWLREPLEALDGQSVLGLMTEGSMLRLMVAKDFIGHLNGR